MKKPILVFALKCFAIIYATAFTNIDKFTIAPTVNTEISSDKMETISSKAKFVSLQNNIPVADNLYITHL